MKSEAAQIIADRGRAGSTGTKERERRGERIAKLPQFHQY
jgi:hypothetical protein